MFKEQGVAGVMDAGRTFVEGETQGECALEVVSLEQFFEDPAIPEDACFLRRIQGAAMYPMLFSFVQFNDKDIEYPENVSRVFYSSSEKALCMVLYRKKKQP